MSARGGDAPGEGGFAGAVAHGDKRPADEPGRDRQAGQVGSAPFAPMPPEGIVGQGDRHLERGQHAPCDPGAFARGQCEAGEGEPRVARSAVVSSNSIPAFVASGAKVCARSR